MTATPTQGHPTPPTPGEDPADVETDLPDAGDNPGPDDWTEPVDDAADEFVMAADRVTIDVPEDDPFAGTLSFGSDNVELWLSLTPTVATDLIEQLEQVLRRQQEVMGIPAGRRLPLTPDDDLEEDPDEEQIAPADEEGGFFARNRDPLGVRYLVGRSKNAPLMIAGGIAILLLLSVVVSRIL